jgi:hypothetical protein
MRAGILTHYSCPFKEIKDIIAILSNNAPVKKRAPKKHFEKNSFPVEQEEQPPKYS